ncbi:hypothetical protein BH23CHL2_BH23CHL2_26460 [soil metagenome]
MEAWIDRQIAFYLRHWVAVSSLFALAVVAGAVAIPLLAAGGFDTLAWAGYKAYRLICPQQPSHSWFIAGEKMGFEHRETAMFLAAAIAGPAYVLLKRLGFTQLNGKIVLLLIVPILYDVFSQVVGLRDSTGFWRSVTGGLAVFAIAGWLYPLIDGDFQKSLATIARKQARREREALAATDEPVTAD